MGHRKESSGKDSDIAGMGSGSQRTLKFTDPEGDQKASLRMEGRT